MATTKRELVKRIAKLTNQKQDVTKEIIQTFLDEIIDELSKGNRLEFREFGVFDIVNKKPRVARNPRTGETVHVPAKRMVHFKVGRLMKQKVMDDNSQETSIEESVQITQDNTVHQDSGQPEAAPSRLDELQSP